MSNSSRLWDRFEDASHDNGMQMTSISNDAITALEAAEKRIAELESRTVTAAAAAVLAERKRQVAMRFPLNCSIVPVSRQDRGRGLMNGGSQLIAAVTWLRQER